MEILKITIDYISRNGIKSFSLRNIAEAIGIKQPTLYDHFDSKEAILRGIFNLYKFDVLSYNNDLASLNIPKLTKIKMYFLKMSEFIQYKPDYMNLVWFELYQHRDIFENDLTFLLDSMKKIIANGKDDVDINGEIDYEWIIVQIYGILHYFLKSKLLSEDFDVLKNADEYWNTLESLLKSAK
ncbi:MAG: TetR/AcrR family transcriptional regulator [Bacteroidota bacterium]|nr:TetR/AcrR family transcriptional regulator [Bacteroidota bacterium]